MVVAESVIVLGAATIIGLLAWVIKLLIEVDRKLAVICQWSRDHETHDNERFAKIEQKIEKLRDKIYGAK